MTTTPQASRDRFARHLTLDGFGAEAQQRLARSRVLVVGAGGLGSPVLAYLAAAGVGTIHIVDDDVVDLGNLQRQVLFGEADTGTPKVDAAARRITDINGDVAVVRHASRLDVGNVATLVANVDVVVDCSDNFATRYLVNDACAQAGIACVWGSVHEYSGQVAVWWAGRGPCYRCLHPEPPPPGAFASCAEAGVLGSVCAVVGGIQATEAIKVLTGIGEPLVGRVFLHDALACETTVVSITRDPTCMACGAVPAAAATFDTTARAGEIHATDLRASIGRGDRVTVIDTRDAPDFAVGSIPGAVNIPIDSLLADPTRVPRGRAIVVYCGIGVSSRAAVAALAAHGVTAVNLRGGWAAWTATASRPPVSPDHTRVCSAVQAEH